MRHLLAKSLLLISITLAALFADAFEASKTRVHTLLNGHQIVSEVQTGNKATFVLLNGLVYATNRWSALANDLNDRGHTVIRMAYPAQPESLRLLKNGDTPAFFKTGLSLPVLANDVHETLLQLGVNQKFNLVGLSYGASVATEFALRHASLIEQFILISPLVISLDSYDSGGAAVRTWLDSVRRTENFSCDLYGAFNPLLCAYKDHWYDLYYASIYEPYLNKRITDIPAGVDASIHKKSMFHLVRAARDFDLRKQAPKLANVHLLVASEDSAPLRADQERAWNLFSASQKRSHVTFKGAFHAVPDEAPAPLSEVLNAIVLKSDEYMRGDRLVIDLQN
ncbi:MAG: alpha/beta hydrolase [Bdellovibrionota bacterium]